MTNLAMQPVYDTSNQRFWDELCGTQMARSLGITDYSPASLKKFDDWYFKYYPYLERQIPFSTLKGKKILEVGLGYGTVSARLAQSGALYTGLDVAAAPVDLINLRLRDSGLPGEAVRGSILAAPFADASFDAVVAIGCLHHTGGIVRAIQEAHRVLRPGGLFICMVYYAYSYRRWTKDIAETTRYFLWDQFGIGANNAAGLESIRGQYDKSSAGEAAPFTEFISRHHMSQLLAGMGTVTMHLENINQEGVLRLFTREKLLQTVLPRLCGLDLYVQATKPDA